MVALVWLWLVVVCLAGLLCWVLSLCFGLFYLVGLLLLGLCFCDVCGGFCDLLWYWFSEERSWAGGLLAWCLSIGFVDCGACCCLFWVMRVSLWIGCGFVVDCGF